MDINKAIFEKVIAAGFLSHDRTAKNYVGLFMYMHTKDNMYAFKHYNTRTYLMISIDII